MEMCSLRPCQPMEAVLYLFLCFTGKKAPPRATQTLSLWDLGRPVQFPCSCGGQGPGWWEGTRAWLGTRGRDCGCPPAEEEEPGYWVLGAACGRGRVEGRGLGSCVLRGRGVSPGPAGPSPRPRGLGNAPLW